jgi:hypothetical protein
MAIKRINSGAQTGADRAAHDVAIELDMDYGGYVPKGRQDERGDIPPRYVGLIETRTPEWKERTKRNVETSSKTLIFTRGKPTGGTLTTVLHAVRVEKPFLLVDLKKCSIKEAAILIGAWLAETPGDDVNVAGPRASQDAEIYADVTRILSSALKIASHVDQDELKEKMANFRHWDLIRWTSIFWYLGFSAPAAALAFDQDTASIKFASCFTMAAFGALVTLLINNTQKYHEKAGIPKGYGGISFALKGWKSWFTATQWAKTLAVFLTIAWGVAAFSSLLISNENTSASPKQITSLPTSTAKGPPAAR